jgi:hypothetical protein
MFEKSFPRAVDKMGTLIEVFEYLSRYVSETLRAKV